MFAYKFVRVCVRIRRRKRREKKKRNFNPFISPACKISGLKSAHTHACKQYVWRSYNKPTVNTVQSDRRPFTRSCQAEKEGKKSLNDFKFGRFIRRFPSDGAACMAVEGLKSPRSLPHMAEAINEDISTRFSPKVSECLVHYWSNSEMCAAVTDDVSRTR